MDAAKFSTRFFPADDEDENAGGVEAAWQNECLQARTTCSHGVRCRKGSACNVGKSISKASCITGSLFSIWKEIGGVLRKVGGDGDGAKIQVSSFTADDGKTHVVGVIMDTDRYQALKDVIFKRNAKETLVRQGVVVELHPTPPFTVRHGFPTDRDKHEYQQELFAWMEKTFRSEKEMIDYVGFSLDHSGIVMHSKDPRILPGFELVDPHSGIRLEGLSDVSIKSMFGVLPKKMTFLRPGEQQEDQGNNKKKGGLRVEVPTPPVLVSVSGSSTNPPPPHNSN
jgi:hypothetical protein